MATTGSDTASLNTIAASLASLTATVASMQGQIGETRQDVRDVKSSLNTLVPQAVYDVQTRDLAARVQAAEARWTNYISVDVFAARVKAVDADLAEIRGTLKEIPDTRRQNLALWLSGAAVLVAGCCGLLGVLANVVLFIIHH